MQAPPCLERDALAAGESATLLTVSQCQFLALGERAYQKHQMLEADARLCHQFVVSLECLTKQLPAREVGESLLIDGRAGAWQCAE